MDENKENLELGEVMKTTEAPVTRQDNSGKIWLIVIAVLLAGLLTLNLLQFFAQKSQQELDRKSVV